MSYLGQTSYQQKWPHSHSDQGYYGPQQGYRNEPEQRYRMDDRNARDDRGYHDQRNEYNNYNNNAQQYGGYRQDPPPDREPRGGSSQAAPSHRYPETFHDNRQPQNRSSWGPRNDQHQTNDGGYQNQQYQGIQGSNNFRDRGRSQSPVNHDNRGPYDPYNRDRQPDSQNQNWDNPNQQPHHHDRYNQSHNQPLSSPGWQSRGRDDQRYPPPPDSMYSNQAPNSRDQSNHSTQVNSDWRQDPPHQNDHQPRSYEQPRNGYSDYNQHPQSQPQYNDRYRDNDYGRDVQQSSKPPSEPPQIMAKTSGSSAVFGIVARVDTSPTRRGEPSPIRTDPPVTSPTREYAPQFDQYRNPEPNRSQQPPSQTSQQHQYHHALTPISEKPSPPSSSGGSRGQPHENSWQVKSTNDQYDNQNISRPPWHGQPDRGYSDQRNGPPPQGGSSYSNNTQPPQQSHDRPQQHQPRTGYRDYEHTESSGYGSESTHYTERSYNEPQRFPDKGQYDNRYPSEPQRIENFPRSPVESYARSPPRGHDEGYSDRYRQDNIHSPSQSDIRSQSQRFDQKNYQQEPYNPPPPQDSYGPPVSVSQQRPYNKRPPDDRYHQPYNNRGPPPNQNQSYGPCNDTNPPLRSPNAESGVEESHVKSVRAAKNMFEKQSDPRRPPPAPKPLIAPKPNNVRPIPPRPSNFSNNENWGPRPDNRDQYQPHSPQGPKSPRSPNYDPRPQAHYQSRIQPSQSLDNLDDRTRYQPPPAQRPPQHAQSMQNLDDRSQHPLPPQRSYPPPGHRPQGENYRNSYSGGNNDTVQPDNRPMVVAVKYNQDTGASVYTAQEPPRHESWDRPRPESDRPRPQASSPTRPHAQRSSWSTELNRGNHQQSYNDNNRNAATNNSQINYGQSRIQNNNTENRNYVPDVVARSYEMANQSQQQQEAQPQYTQDSYNDHRQEPLYESRRQPLQNTPENRNSSDRWPTPPPPLSQDQTPPRPTGSNYNDNWRRPGPPPTQPQSRPPNERRSDYPPKNPTIHLPPPPQQPYPYDSDSSEIDVDAPTPPPSGKQSRILNFALNNRGESPYERNKPVPVGARNPDSWRRLPHQPQNVTQPDEPPYSKPLTQNNQSSIKSPPPQKPQRNSTSLSPKLARTSVSSNQNDDFDLDVTSTAPLANQTSRERMRLVKSGGMANRKPPSRQGSTSNLLSIGDEDDFQIEVTDSDLSNKATPIEVHRLESMRILNAKKEKEKNAPSSVLERQSKQRASQKLVQPPMEEDEPSAGRVAPYKKPDTKLLYKMPSADAAKTIPMPQITEPVKEATRRPPTYLGFGNTPEKPKTDLLSQFKSARDSALRTAAQKQDKAMKSVSALVKFSHAKKEPKSPPKPKLTPAEKNAKVLDKMNVEVRAPEEDDRDRSSHHHRHDDERRNVGRSSTRSSSTIKAEKYDGDDDTTNGSRHGRDARGRGRDRQRDSDRAKSRGRSTSRGRNISPDDHGRSRHRSKSRERSLSPEDRRRPRKDQGDRRYDDRSRRDDDSSYHRRSHSPDYHRYRGDDRFYPQRAPQHRQPPYGGGYRPAREPDWVEQFRRGREATGHHPARRAWVNDPRRVEVTTDGRRRELDMDAFEREVKRATSYNSDFEQPEPRRQMFPTKLMAKGPPQRSKRQPPPNGDWMNALKEKNKNAARARFGHVPRY